jgi:hypothetical protein
MTHSPTLDSYILDEWRPMRDAPPDRSVWLLYTPPNSKTPTQVVARYFGGGAWAEIKPDGSTGGMILDPQGWKPYEELRYSRH